MEEGDENVYTAFADKVLRLIDGESPWFASAADVEWGKIHAVRIAELIRASELAIAFRDDEVMRMIFMMSPDLRQTYDLAVERHSAAWTDLYFDEVALVRRRKYDDKLLAFFSAGGETRIPVSVFVFRDGDRALGHRIASFLISADE